MAPYSQNKNKNIQMLINKSQIKRDFLKDKNANYILK